MIDRICLLLEALSVVICLHHLYGEKFRLDIKTVGFLAVDMIIMEFINHYELSKSYTMIIYPIIFIYSGMKFGFKLRKLFVNNLLCIAIGGVVQLVSAFVCFFVFKNPFFSNIQLLLVNICSFLIMLFIITKMNFQKIIYYLHRKGKVLVLTIGIGVTVVIICLLGYKALDKLLAYEYFMLFFVIVFMCFLCAQLEKYKLKSKEVAIELKMHELYADSFNSLIENIRFKQHEFDNHINTIYSQHLLCNTYEELVDMQKNYCQALERNNRYNKLLKSGNHVIRGFLYTKFLEIEKFQIDVSYEIIIDKLEMKMPIYKLVEILGNLINNAVDAMVEEEEERRLHVSMVEIENHIEIEVRNTSKYIARSDISKFFDKGYSKKGENRGLGLYNVKEICEEYGYDLACDNKMIDEQNWISFLVVDRK